MAHENGPAFGGMPLGILELNVFIGGLETATCIGVYCFLSGWTLPHIQSASAWWIAPAVVVGGLGLSILGLAVEGVAGIVERIVTRRGWFWDMLFARGDVYGWYARVTNHPGGEVWAKAQRWIWTSPQAAAEYARRRLRILVARNTAFNFLLGTILGAILVCKKTGAVGPVFLTVVGGLLVTALFVFVWLDANRTYHRAIADAGDVDHGTRPHG